MLSARLVGQLMQFGQLRRREFMTLLGGAAGWPLAAHAQQGERVRRVGALAVLAKDDPEAKAHEAAFQQALAGLGWTVGGNLRIDYRWAAGDANRLPKYAAELVGLAPDVILSLLSRLLACGTM
jgi:hypothetical protein